MSEQLNQMQNMLEQLIKMVGSNNASIEELRQDVTTIKLRMDSLEVKVDSGFEGLTNMVNLLGEKTDRIEAKLDALNDRTFEHEADIRLLKKVR
ncbi:hypothetical protein SOV_22390 [Sporomusa ovata DSM 2662]|uniref:Uncharacterized protein n=1 Tax=Sporomusa ovata TaxID=2378 RepID=A0A0U1L341_9FIRM|nr:hypothetical protein [Sporomusa ovata]EQB25555.1 hypothetical protein SOV_4c02180 [Sporomusa ovata DSM 2662]CQR74117.1 hypothetical protein SpAn4DRAFT_0579 [Sporomusa ovata]